MTDNRSKEGQAPAEGIEQILMERERLEHILEEKFAREVVILFSDICGYTRYIDSYGDISGRSMLLKHNQMVLPLIEKHGGRVIEVIGDAVMAAFSEPQSAVFSAVDIQEKLGAYNAAVHSKDAIRVKIGIHAGRVLVDESAQRQSLTGDVANLAARIQEQAGPDQILISSVIYERVCNCDDILCRFHDLITFKGKSGGRKIYRVIWQDEDLVIPQDTRMRGEQESVRSSESGFQRVFNIEMGRDGEKLIVSAQEGARGESLTIRDYETLDVSMSRIGARCSELVDSLNRASQRGRVTRDVFFKMREIGQVLYDELFTASIKERLEHANATFLCLNLDESLIHIPWELLNDGRRFLCERFAVGRIVRTRRSLSGIRERRLARPLRFLIIADPTGDLKGAYQEGTRIRDLLDGHVETFNVALRADAINAESIRKKLRNFDIVHFAGHADYKSGRPDQSGWRLADGFFTTGDIDKMAGSAAMPALIFSNSCQSAWTENTLLAPDFQQEIFGMANSFLLSGVKHYMGTFWQIMDEPSNRFALEFYEHLSNGMSIGESVQQARRALIQQYGEDNIVWASYLLYGDPSFNYVHQVLDREETQQAPGEPARISGEGARTREEVVSFGESPSGAKKRRWYTFAAALLVVLLVATGYFLSGRSTAEALEQEAVAAFQNGNYAGAEEICDVLGQKHPNRPLSHLIMGDIYLRRNALEKARAEYRRAMEGGPDSSKQAARAMLGLGRILSVEGKKQEALESYEKAADLFPGYRDALVSKAALLAEQGNYDQSLEAFGAISASGKNGDPLLAAAINEIRRRGKAKTDREKQERIDQLAEELISQMETGQAAARADAWSASPLTVWLMDFELQGPPVLQEGAGFLLQSGLMAELLENPRIQVVERELMDRLMAELRLGSDKLADRDTALSLGRIAAAKVILSGRIIQTEAGRQVIVRAIETETGQIFASVSQEIESLQNASEAIRALRSRLTEKLYQQFPVKGRIAAIERSLAVLDIGKKHGVEKGQSFRVLDVPVFMEIVSVQEGRSHAAPAGDPGLLSPGMKVALSEEVR